MVTEITYGQKVRQSVFEVRKICFTAYFLNDLCGSPTKKSYIYLKFLVNGAAAQLRLLLQRIQLVLRTIQSVSLNVMQYSKK